ncbi:MAG: fructose-bisphosphate aldolase [Candidatus Poseidoniales archaeon]|nr:MAG: fructose-bisphosphate aldolase [Candidatus Poseidoniales archaeon]
MGKADLLSKILPGGRGVWIPIDHGVTDFPVEGLTDVESTIKSLISAGVDAIIAHKGLVGHYHKLCENTNTNMIVHLSASTRHGGIESSNKVLVGSVDEVRKRGGIGVSCQVNLGSEKEPEMMERMGEVSRQALLEGIPMFGMVYARGPNLNIMEDDETNGYSHAARLAFELGCDAAKTVWTGDKESFTQITNSAPIPLLVAGGPSTGDSRAILTMVRDAMDSGASGVCMGRQVFGHPQVESIARAIVMLVHQDASVDEAIMKCSL